MCSASMNEWQNEKWLSNISCALRYAYDACQQSASLFSRHTNIRYTHPLAYTFISEGMKICFKKQYAFWMAMQCVRPIGCKEKIVARFNQIFNLNEWKRWNQTTKQTFSSFRDSVVFALDCASKLDLNGGRLVLRFTCCSTRFCFSFYLSFLWLVRIFFGVPRAKWILECFYGWFFSFVYLVCMWTFNKYDYSTRMRNELNEKKTHHRSKIAALVCAYMITSTYNPIYWMK